MNKCKWPIGNGQTLEFDIYNPNVTWNPVGGLYVFAYFGCYDSKLKTSCESLRAAISQYFSSISMPMALRPKFFDANRVVPIPIIGSTTTQEYCKLVSLASD